MYWIISITHVFNTYCVRAIYNVRQPGAGCTTNDAAPEPMITVEL
jgi:hypothetical protein